MIEIKKITDEAMRSAAGATSDVLVFAALSSGEMTGYCTFKPDGERIYLLDLFEKDGDLLLADGIVRAAVSSCRDFCKTVVCGDQGFLPQYCAKSGVYCNNEASIADVLSGSCAY